MAVSPELWPRVVSAAVLAPITLALVWFGGAAFAVALAVASLFLAREWVGLVATPGGAIAIGGPAVGALALVYFGHTPAALAGLAVLGVIYGSLARGESRSRFLAGLGPLYVGGACVAVLWLRQRPEVGFDLLLWLLLVVWATDIGAYFVGRAVGGAKLAPAISPGKTWSGLVGGMAAAAAIGGGVAWVTAMVAAFAASVLGAAVAVAAQLGDLFESWLKRRQGVKDSGTLIPGHGGLLDRVDGLMTAAPGLAILAWLTEL